MTELAAAAPVDDARAPALGRWWQLILGVICMSMIANLQYGWTLFVNPIHDAHGWTLSAIQVAFTVFVLVETWLVPIEGYLVDRIGPRFVGVGAMPTTSVACTPRPGNEPKNGASPNVKTPPSLAMSR